jgi:hypothetical protein
MTGSSRPERTSDPRSGCSQEVYRWQGRQVAARSSCANCSYQDYRDRAYGGQSPYNHAHTTLLVSERSEIGGEVCFRVKALRVPEAAIRHDANGWQTGTAGVDYVRESCFRGRDCLNGQSLMASRAVRVRGMDGPRASEAARDEYEFTYPLRYPLQRRLREGYSSSNPG